MAELILFGAHAWPTMLCVVLYLGLSALIGQLIRWRDADGLALGFLIVAAGANLALFVLRLAPVSLHWLAPLTTVFAVTIALALRRWALPAFVPRTPRLSFEWILLTLVLAGYWVIRIIQAEPSSGLSSQLGWTPNYLRASLEAGRFLLPQDFALGNGPAQFLYYSVDLLGMSAIPASLGWTVFYPAYLASSIVAGALALTLALGSLRGHAAGQAVFLILAALIASGDLQFQAALFRHWGDSILILGGTLIMTRLCATGRFENNMRTVCVVSLFLVFGRHYGAFFAALLLCAAAGEAMWRDWRAALREWPRWLVLALLLILFSLREINYILHPTLYYPGNKLLTLVGSGVGYHLRGVLYDWGLLTDGNVVARLARLAWIPAFAALIWSWSRHRLNRLTLLAPLAVMLLPLALHTLTGYRSALTVNKPYLLGLLFLPWFPALAVAGLTPEGLRHRLARMGLWAVVTTAVATMALVLSGQATPLLARVHDTYQTRNTDLNIARALETAGRRSEAESHAILYFYCEPGMGLRSYLGGNLRQDVDFWGDRTQALMEDVQSLPQLLEKLGWPNLYLSSHANYGDFVPSKAWGRFHPGNGDLSGESWVEQVVEAGSARFVVVKRPNR